MSICTLINRVSIWFMCSYCVPTNISVSVSFTFICHDIKDSSNTCLLQRGKHRNLYFTKQLLWQLLYNIQWFLYNRYIYFSINKLLVYLECKCFVRQQYKTAQALRVRTTLRFKHFSLIRFHCSIVSGHPFWIISFLESPWLPVLLQNRQVSS